MKRLAFAVGQSAVLSLTFTVLWLCGAVAVFSILPGWSAYSISSGSMSPVLDIGDVVISSTSEKNVVQGEVVTFRRNGEIFTHRIADVQSGLFITKGDANPTNDSDPLPASNIIGKAQIVLPGAGLLGVWVAERNWINLSVIAALSIASVYFLKVPKALSVIKEARHLKKRSRYRAEVPKKNSPMVFRLRKSHARHCSIG